MTSRVAHVLRKYDPARWGGVETHVAALTGALSEGGWAPEVHAPLGPKTPDHALSVPLRRFRSCLPFLASSSRRRALAEVGGNLVSFDALRKLVFDRGLSLTHVHTQRRIGGVARSAMRWTGRPYVVSVHGPLLSAQDFIDEEDQRRRAKTIDLGKPFGALVGSRRVIDDASRVIVFNEAERRAMERRVGDKVVKLDQGVDSGRMSGGSMEAARRRWPAFADRPVVLVLGRVGVQKNQSFALEVLSRSSASQTHLVFAGGETDPGVREALIEKAARLGLSERVHHLGNVEPTHVPDLLAATTVLLAPSRHEAFGLQVLEGWAAGCVALFASVGGLGDLGACLADPSCCLDGFDVDQWSAKLSELLSRPRRRRRHVEEGRELIRRRFDWKVVAERHAGLYRDVLREHRRW